MRRLHLFLFLVLLPVTSLAEQYLQVESVKNGKSFTLVGGEVVRLASIQTPNVEELDGAKRPGEPLGEEAKTHLESLVLGKEVRISYVGEADTQYRDRHGRLVGQVYTKDGVWVQGEMLKSGYAMVYSFPDEHEWVLNMLPLEREAREAKRGVWGNDYYTVLPVERALEREGRFSVVEGVVQDIAVKKGNAYINFGADWKTDFTLFIDKAAMKQFRKYDLPGLKGKRIRSRGWIYERNGPAIDLTHPEQVEILD